MKANAKSKRAEAERAAVWFAVEAMGCVHPRRAVKTQYQSVDFWGCDVMGKRPDGSKVFIQVTAGQDSAVTARRRKLEQNEPWHQSDTVLLLQLVQTQDPANARRTNWFFRIHAYDRLRLCYSTREGRTEPKAFPVPKHWFKAWKEEG